MKMANQKSGLLLGMVALAALGFSPITNAVPIFPSSTFVSGISAGGIDMTLSSLACPYQCVDLAQSAAGYTISGGGVVNPAANQANRYKTPGFDTGNSGNVYSYNVISSIDDPNGATTPMDITGLNNAFNFYWGSVDDYNNIDFYSGGTIVASLTGVDAMNLATAAGVTVHPTAAGGGTNYNFDGYYSFAGGQGLTFDKVELSSSNGVAFEFAAVPEPSTLALLGLGIIGFGFAVRRKRA